MIKVREMVISEGKRVEGDKVDIGRNEMKKIKKKIGIVENVVDIIKNKILKSDEIGVRKERILEEGFDEIRKRIFFVDRKKNVEKIVEKGM